MTIKIEIPSILTSLTAGQTEIRADGKTVIETLNALDHCYPGLSARLLSDNKIHRFINVYLNDQDVRSLKSELTELTAGDCLTILPAVAGG